MSLSIKHSTFLEARKLTVDSAGFTFRGGQVFSTNTRHRYAEIQCILMSQKGVLSIQLAGRAHSIQTKPWDRKHAEVIRMLVAGAQSGL